MKRNGYTKSECNAVFTDHKIAILKQKCTNKECACSDVPSVRSLFGTTAHPDLTKMQCELGADHTYRESQEILNKKVARKHTVNNHERVHHVIEKIVCHLAKTVIKDPVIHCEEAAELVIQVDGGHLKDKNPNQRSLKL